MKRVQETQGRSKMLKLTRLKDPYEWKKEQKQNTRKAHSLRKAHFEKAQSKINRKLRVKNLCSNSFVVFLKCTLEKGLGGFQQKHGK